MSMLTLQIFFSSSQDSPKHWTKSVSYISYICPISPSFWLLWRFHLPKHGDVSRGPLWTASGGIVLHWATGRRGAAPSAAAPSRQLVHRGGIRGRSRGSNGLAQLHLLFKNQASERSRKLVSWPENQHFEGVSCQSFLVFMDCPKLLNEGAS